jgi:hypothetical protein
VSGADHIRVKAKTFMMGLPGKKGHDIPEYLHDRIRSAAVGITQSIWGRNPTPHQLQYLYDQGLHTPDQISDAFGALPHPHADGLTVAEFPRYAEAYGVFEEHK